MWYVGNVPIVERNHGLVVAGFLFTTLACLAGSMRIFTRAVLVRNMGLDDAFIIAAMLGTIAFQTAVVEQIKYGLGDAVQPDVIENFLQALLATVVSYSFTQLVVKFSILLQCRRIFKTAKAQRIFTVFLIWLTVYGLFCFFSSLITCVPLAKYWDDSIPGGCINRSNLHYALAGFNILNDICLLIAPLPFLRQLQIARRAKIILLGVFCCGGFACIVAIIRLHSLYVNNSAPIDQQPLFGVDIALWSGLEINVAIICACVPALKPLFVKVFPHLVSSFADSSKRSRPGRSTHGTLPLSSFDRRHGTNDRDRDSDDKDLTIQVRQSFEMKAVAADRDDSSDKNLVTGPGSSWTAECYSGRNQP